MGKCGKARKIKENQHIRRNANMIKILFICHGRSQSMSCLAAFGG
ncbi:hypothetical protein RUMHYD_01428 [Blautia hydrogenotrophica DSM 10507]|uniref:Uncharacterized protein n=1 Tax=Blautia hydrogenotrophica (strain DSM 10507 / JCM 14656 / S5a33) TaxID=476272 RepID=C0CKQ8_BLAHS|nr:hypothetical protein RUMHYD_01428 [Blautia hydrogenotrophica DSM 10507]